jgi:diguanylate cyclase (GGDEF)-like protein/PAS domain S-box-containing protein
MIAMTSTRPRTPSWRTLRLPLAAALVAAALVSTAALQRLDDLLYDTIEGHRSAPSEPPIAIVAIDGRSLQALGRWPWSRRLHARLVDLLTEAEVRAVGLDIVFAEPDGRDLEADKLLADSLRRNGKVVLPVLPEAMEGEADGLKATLPLPLLAAAAADLGHTDVDVEADGKVRHAYLEAGIGSFRWASFPLALLRTAYPDFRHTAISEIRATPAEQQRGIWVRDRRILIPYSEASGRLQSYSYVDVLQGRIDRSQLKDKLVLIGPTATGLAPRFSTPLQDGTALTSGVELNANILKGWLSGDTLSPLSPPWSTVLTAVATFLTVLALRLVPSRLSPLILLAGCAATLTISLGLLMVLQRWFSPVSAVVAMLLSYPLWAWRRLEQAIESLLTWQHSTRGTLDSIADGLIVTDSSGTVEFLNAKAEALTGYGLDEVRGRSLESLMTEIFGETLPAGCPVQAAKSGAFSEARPVKSRYGQDHFVELSVSSVGGHGRTGSRFMYVLRDVTESTAQMTRLRYLATHDALTELPNRALMRDRLNASLERGKREGWRFAVCLVDLDGFKQINDELGHAVGDFLLRAAAARLRAGVRKLDTVSRWGGDEFILLLDGIHDDTTVRGIASELLDSLSKPFEIAGREACVTLSMGVSLFPWDGGTIDDLLDKADLAMYRVKGNGKNHCALYSDRYDLEGLPREPWHALRARNREISLSCSPEDEAKLQAIRQRAAMERDSRPAADGQPSLLGLLGRIKVRRAASRDRAS